LAGNAKINQHHLIGAFTQNDIFRLNIPVHQALLMNFL
jgi:hypothetical protein